MKSATNRSSYRTIEQPTLYLTTLATENV